ncbi:MAG: GAP family protein, partial [Chloroflexota bacterium]|nr:GAP family protein [Chloroflexota bacterium]
MSRRAARSGATEQVDIRVLTGLGMIGALADTGLTGILVFGLALAASPLGLIGVLTLLATDRPIANASAFAAGWLLAIVVVEVLAYRAVAQAAEPAQPPVAVSVAELVIAVGLLAYATRLWRRRHQGEAKEPAFLKKVRRIRPTLAFVLGAFLPTYALVLPVVQRVQAAEMSKGAAAAALLSFAVVATLGIAVPLVLFATRPATRQHVVGWQTLAI